MKKTLLLIGKIFKRYIPNRTSSLLTLLMMDLLMKHGYYSKQIPVLGDFSFSLKRRTNLLPFHYISIVQIR